MNSTPVGPEKEQLDELRELEGLLPAGPAEQVLSPGRRAHHKDVLMQLIDNDSASHSANPNPDHSGSRGESAGSSSRFGGGDLYRVWERRWSRPALVAGVVAAALAAGLTVGIGPGREADGTA